MTGSKRNSSFSKLNTTGEGGLVLGPERPHGGELGLLEGRGFQGEGRSSLGLLEGFLVEVVLKSM